MSTIVAQFDPTTSTSTQFAAPNSSANGALVFFNESQQSIILSFSDGSNMYLPAWYHRHKCGSFGSVNVSWVIHATLNSGSPPLSVVIVEAYAQGEHFPADGPLVRQANGDTTSTVTGSTLVNTGNPPGTQNIIQIAASDAPTGKYAWQADNIGNLAIQQDIAGVFTYLLRLIQNAGSGAGVILGDANNAVFFAEVAGSHQVDGNLIVFGSSSLDAGDLQTDGAGNVTKIGTINGVYLDNNAGSSLARIGTSAANAGNVLDAPTTGGVYIKSPSNGTFNFQSPNGTTRWSMAAMNTGTIGGSGTFNHGLGGTPQAVLLTPQSSGNTTTVSAYSYTSTQFTTTIFTSMTIRWWAYR